MRVPGAATHGRVVGYRVADASNGRSVVYLPCVQQLTPEVLDELADCTALLAQEGGSSRRQAATSTRSMHARAIQSQASGAREGSIYARAWVATRRSSR